MDRLTIEEVLATAHCPDTTHEGKLAKQLADSMREVERLVNTIKKQPHSNLCNIIYDSDELPCNCWKKEALSNKESDNG